MNNHQNQPRRQIAYLGSWNTLILDRRNPYVVAFWSIAYAGFGHILLDKYLRGFILVVGEILLNYFSHLNMAIYYTVTMQPDMATRVLDMRFFPLYMAIYAFSIFDSFRETVNINNLYTLASREDAPIPCFSISANAFSHLNSVSPATAMVCSAVLPGAGCFMLQRMFRAFFLIILWVTVAWLSNLFPACIYTLGGSFSHAKSVLNIQWFLNIPSIWFFGIYEAYACAIENNKLYRRELNKFLKTNYQDKQFMMPDFSRAEE